MTQKFSILDHGNDMLVELSKLSPKYGDIVVVRHPPHNAIEHERLINDVKLWQRHFGADVRLLLIPNDMSIELLTPEQMQLSGWVRREEFDAFHAYLETRHKVHELATRVVDILENTKLKTIRCADHWINPATGICHSCGGLE